MQMPIEFSCKDLGNFDAAIDAPQLEQDWSVAELECNESPDEEPSKGGLGCRNTSYRIRRRLGSMANTGWARRWQSHGNSPYGTFVINITACMIIVLAHFPGQTTDLICVEVPRARRLYWL